MVAAGSGTRLRSSVPKAMVPLAGEPILVHAVRGALDVPAVAQVVVVAPFALVGEIAERYAGQPQVVVVAGGAERTDSVAAGLAAVDPDCDIVLVHDAARCLTPGVVFQRVIEAVRDGESGVIPGLPVVDTIKVVDSDGHVTATPDRATLRAVQTPQGFPRETLAAAYASAATATDDAALVEALGARVRVVDGNPDAFKITTPDDLERAERVLAARRSRNAAPAPAPDLAEDRS